MTTSIVSLNESQIDEAGAIAASAFENDPIFQYLAPESNQARSELLRYFCNLMIQYSQPYHQVYTTAGELKGVAVWIPPEGFPFNWLRWLRLGRQGFPFKLGVKGIWRSLSVLFQLDDYHKQEMPDPHWYLNLLGVAPAHQQQGIGGLLLQPVLKQADQQGLPCYLETSTEAAVRFYQRHGFEVVKTGKLAADGPCFWTMKREPSRAKSGAV